MTWMDAIRDAEAFGSARRRGRPYLLEINAPPGLRKVASHPACDRRGEVLVGHHELGFAHGCRQARIASSSVSYGAHHVLTAKLGAQRSRCGFSHPGNQRAYASRESGGNDAQERRRMGWCRVLGQAAQEYGVTPCTGPR